MKTLRLIFPFFFFLVIVLSWLIPAYKQPAGYFPKSAFPAIGIKAMADASFQKDVEKFFSTNIPSLPYLLYTKNDIYELLNMGQFHSGYSGKIVQGKNGILFEKNYLICSYGYTDQEKLSELAARAARKLNLLEQLLRPYGVNLVLLLAPSKVDFFTDEVPWYYARRSKHPFIGSQLAAPIFSREMEQGKVNFVNCYPAIARAGDREMAFPDRGIHWTRYAGALCLRELAAKLHSVNPAEFPLVEIEGRIRTNEGWIDEYDMAELLNIRPKYSKGKDYFFLPRYKSKNYQIPFTIIGDSFMNAIIWNMIASGYSSHNHIYSIENSMPEKEQFLKDISRSKVLILIANTTKFVQPYFENIADKLITYLQPSPEDSGKQEYIQDKQSF